MDHRLAAVEFGALRQSFLDIATLQLPTDSIVVNIAKLPDLNR
jgi:hypothetical protein